MEYTKLASTETAEKVILALLARGVVAEIVASGAEALARIKALIPTDASVMNGSSVTLEQIGYIEYLKSGAHPWKNLKADILAEPDPGKQAELRKHSVVSDWYLGSVHALAEDGQFLIASNTGSQLPHVVFTSPNIIFVVSTKKIVPTIAEAFTRLEEYVVPLEDQHMLDLYKIHTQISKILIWRNEAKMLNRKVHLLLVSEDLGF